MLQSEEGNEEKVEENGEDRPQITFVLVQTNQKWSMDARLRNFSEFLKHMIDDHTTKPSDDETEIDVPPFLAADRSVFELIEQFHRMHGYSRKGIKITKIRTTGWFNSLDPVSLSFAEKQLQSQSPEFLKVFLNVCEYFKFDLLKEVGCLFVASKNYFAYNDVKMQKELEDQNVFYSRQMEIDLKRNLLGYARQLSKDMLEKYEAKQAKKREGK